MLNIVLCGGPENVRETRPLGDGILCGGLSRQGISTAQNASLLGLAFQEER
jgi:hypothetical protein